MFTSPLAIVSYAVVEGRLELLTVILELDSDQQSTADFAEDFTNRFARAGDENFGYRLVSRNKAGGLIDYYTRKRLDVRSPPLAL